MSSSFSQRCRQPSDIPKSLAIWESGASLRRATATTSRRNSAGNALGMVTFLPVRTHPHTSGVNQTLGSPDWVSELLAIGGKNPLGVLYFHSRTLDQDI
jgi:hypothetical protein